METAIRIAQIAMASPATQWPSSRGSNRLGCRTADLNVSLESCHSSRAHNFVGGGTHSSACLFKGCICLYLSPLRCSCVRLNSSPCFQRLWSPINHKGQLEWSSRCHTEKALRWSGLFLNREPSRTGCAKRIDVRCAPMLTYFTMTIRRYCWLFAPLGRRNGL